MPATSAKQRRLMGMALAAKRGKLKHPSAEVSKVAKGMSQSQLRDFAKKPAAKKPVSKRKNPARGKIAHATGFSR